MKIPDKKDVVLSFHGSINLLRPESEQARAWIDEHVGEEAQFFGDDLAVEPRFAAAIVQGMTDDGLNVFTEDGGYVASVNL
jgi:hypothetical protein